MIDVYHNTVVFLEDLQTYREVCNKKRLDSAGQGNRRIDEKSPLQGDQMHTTVGGWTADRGGQRPSAAA
ncbi:hypothetical protein CHELA1G11_21184 [Hyphomicrobiales bacterium]|nr:hypothetical protein CHELA1G11_21184 [Hyphomicrobiales bacterium]CAH1693661.1 hypothetical protein CHELA1G2_21491 [Hyphomicrobiales bacterium]